MAALDRAPDAGSAIVLPVVGVAVKARAAGCSGVFVEGRDVFGFACESWLRRVAARRNKPARRSMAGKARSPRPIWASVASRNGPVFYIACFRAIAVVNWACSGICRHKVCTRSSTSLFSGTALSLPAAGGVLFKWRMLASSGGSGCCRPCALASC